jgi:multicomponent K+:H+ antiporter subunit E
MRERLLPHPLLSLTLTVVWVLLVNRLTLGTLLVGLVIGIAVPKLTSSYWPGRPRLRHPLRVLEYLLVFFYDIIVSNIQVAYLILFRRGESLRSQFITVPLDLRAPEAIATLAGTITLTPGTLTADVSRDERALLVHCLEVDDAATTVARIKTRYERRLMRIFA